MKNALIGLLVLLLLFAVREKPAPALIEDTSLHKANFQMPSGPFCMDPRPQLLGPKPGQPMFPIKRYKDEA